MTIGLVGQKCGMTRIFADDGSSIPVTIVSVVPNRIVQVKTVENDGYESVKVAAGKVRANKVNKPTAGIYAKANVDAGAKFLEFRAEGADIADLQVGSELSVGRFADVKFVDVTSDSKGKGFAGVIKRHNFRTQDATHGNSLSHRAPGSIGQCQDPGRVFKGKKMAGQLGNVRCTVQNQQLVRIDEEKNLLFIKGTIPGAANGYVVVKPAVKKRGS
ncbi:MAG: 50S ribosomal protein L3 [Gammaproteobacteria bacterium]|nr:50S ribosomal protein L3 [Gammaproteobacteria bacterium]